MDVRYGLIQTLMGSSAIEVDLDGYRQYTTQLSLAEYDQVIEAFSSHRTQEAFADGIEIGRARRDLHDLDRGAFGHCGEPLPELVIVASDEQFRSVTIGYGLADLLGRPSVGGTAGHIEVNSFPRALDYEEEREDRAKEHIVELQKVACLIVAAVIADERVPALAPCTWWPYVPLVLLDGSFTDADTELQEFTANRSAPRSTLSLAIAWISVTISGASRLG